MDIFCPVCNYKTESLVYVLLTCWWANTVWNGMNMHEWRSLGSFVSLADVIFYLCTTFDTKTVGIGLVTLWYIWGARNKLKHENVSMSPQEAISRMKLLANEYYKYHVDNSIQHFSCSQILFGSPHLLVLRTIKLNCDAHLGTFQLKQ
ncbi:hypothetical protein QQ045_028076 [Rhodiola kirilowii]